MFRKLAEKKQAWYICFSLILTLDVLEEEMRTEWNDSYEHTHLSVQLHRCEGQSRNPDCSIIKSDMKNI